VTTPEYQHQYRQTERGRVSTQVHVTARHVALRWAKKEHLQVWRTLLWVASVEKPDYPPEKIRNAAEVWMLRWVRAQYPSTWSSILDSCWAEVGGKRERGAPRGYRPKADT
jgi:hypothetical protein